jgi:SAM-dependent methyltransferase
MVDDHDVAAFLRFVMGPPPWTPDSIVWGAAEVTVGGWAIPTPAPAFTVNGRPFDSAETALGSPSADYPPLPDGPRRRRVHGAENEDAFVLEGFSSFVKMRRIVERIVGRSYTDFTNILDWGCGCGRFARYFAAVEPPDYVGVDIDADNAAWCAANLPFGRFLHVPFHPPTPLESASFDLLIGISVFTHLSEPDQDEWLAELQRISSPSAILLMTVHGPSSVCRSGLSPEQVLEWRDAGFVDSGRNADLDDVLGESEDYRNVFHTHDYVRRRWARWFDVLEIVPGHDREPSGRRRDASSSLGRHRDGRRFPRHGTPRARGAPPDGRRPVGAHRLVAGA